MTHIDPLVSAEWLSAHLDAPKIKIVDGTWIPDWVSTRGTAHSRFLENHIPGAVYFDIDEVCDENSTFPHMLPSESKFSKNVGDLGISNDDHIIVYDSNNFMASARVWWMFRTMGHLNVSVLDGGMNVWSNEYGELTESGQQEVQTRNYTTNFQKHLIADTNTILALVLENSEPNLQILDARPERRFQGIDPEPRKNLLSGHIPSSVNIPHDQVIGTDGRILDSNNLINIFDTVNPRTICSCGSGVSAAVLALALARLGNFDVSVYDGSWCAWAHNSQHPIVVGSK